jgi:hypothetical protein
MRAMLIALAVFVGVAVSNKAEAYETRYHCYGNYDVYYDECRTYDGAVIRYYQVDGYRYVRQHGVEGYYYFMNGYAGQFYRYNWSRPNPRPRPPAGCYYDSYGRRICDGYNRPPHGCWYDSYGRRVCNRPRPPGYNPRPRPRPRPPGYNPRPRPRPRPPGYNPRPRPRPRPTPPRPRPRPNPRPRPRP